MAGDTYLISKDVEYKAREAEAQTHTHSLKISEESNTHQQGWNVTKYIYSSTF